jgi:hypothetical protein
MFRAFISSGSFSPTLPCQPNFKNYKTNFILERSGRTQWRPLAIHRCRLVHRLASIGHSLRRVSKQPGNISVTRKEQCHANFPMKSAVCAAATPGWKQRTRFVAHSVLNRKGNNDDVYFIPGQSEVRWPSSLQVANVDRNLLRPAGGELIAPPLTALCP